MSRNVLLTVSLMLPLIAGIAHAGQRITDENYWLNEVGPSSQYRPTQTKRDWRHAWARQGGCRLPRSAGDWQLPVPGLAEQPDELLLVALTRSQSNGAGLSGAPSRVP
jgi:hypothetical protein